METTQNPQIPQQLFLYLGCEAVYKNKKMKVVESCTLTPNTYAWLVQDNAHNIEYVKPILRSVSDITEEEATELYELMDWNPDYIHKRLSLTKGFEYLSVREAAKIVDFLRSKFIDCDELLEKGFAINKLKINQ